jgi:CubicO group peptidase (beta-lactamase class C family)
MEPGRQFNYSTMDTAVLAWALERAVGQPIATYMTTRLWEPMGMQANGFWIADGPPGVGRELAGMGFNAQARDYARLGQMMLQGGQAMGRQIVPKQWVTESTASRLIDAPAPGNEPPPPIPLGYGYQWWTLHGTGMYTAIGLQGQFIFVDPATRTVVVKLSFFPPDQEMKLMGESLDFFRAAAAWNSRRPE